MPAESPAAPLHLPLQPNPFSASAVGTPWGDHLTDVAGINDAPFQKIRRAMQQMSVGGRGTSIVLVGEPGSGKTHLLGRLRARLERERKGGESNAVYVYIRCNASAGTLWRHLRYALASDLLKVTETSQLQLILDAHENRLDHVEHRQTRVVLECLRDGRNVHAAAAWLRGETLPEEDLLSLGFQAEFEEAEQDRERDARLIVDALLAFISPMPVVLCFDQVEALETFRGEEAGFHAMGQVISALTLHPNLLLISCVISAYEYNLDRLPNGADRERWVADKGQLRPIDWEQAAQLIRSRLDNAPGLKAPREAHPNSPFWPLDPRLLQPLFAETGLCLARRVLKECERQFDALMPDAPVGRQRSPEETLEELYSQNLASARQLIAKQALSKTLSDTLPWLLQNSHTMPLGHDAMRSRYAAQGWRGPKGDIALAFCDARGVALTNQLRRIEQHWNGKTPKLLIVRDASVRPGQRGAELLSGLKAKGAKEINPLPEALAALQAIRNMAASAKSGELFHNGELISEQAFTGWALAHLPPELTQLRKELAGEPATIEPEDKLLPELAALMRERKIMEASEAAVELKKSLEEVSGCAGRHPMRFGLLAGPPLVIFEATQGARN